MEGVSDFRMSDGGNNPTNGSVTFTCFSLVPIKILKTGMKLEESVDCIQSHQQDLAEKFSNPLSSIYDEKIYHTEDDLELLTILLGCRLFLMNKDIFCVSIPDNLITMIKEALQRNIPLRDKIRNIDTLILPNCGGST